MDGNFEEDRELRHNLILMNEMLDSIIRDANIPTPAIQEVDLTVSTNFEKMSEMLLGKLSVIEACCDTAAISTDKKYDPKMIRDKIALKKKHLAELESENATLTEIARKQEKQIEEMNAGDDISTEQQQHVLKLRSQLQEAQKEIKELEKQRTELINENRRKKGDAHPADRVPKPNQSLSEQQVALKEKENDMEAKKERERRIYEKKMESLKTEKEKLAARKAELEEEIKKKEAILKGIHEKQKKPTPFQKHTK